MKQVFDEAWMETVMQDCCLCPRNCHVNRMEHKKGYCGQGGMVSAARAALHMWEEPCISGEKGSGAVFFSGCTLGCVFCQNYQISDGTVAKEITVERLADIFLELQAQGAQNINLVTPSHFVPQIILALEKAKQGGLDLPIVYNTSGYEKVETLQMLDGLVDIYLPDFKYLEGDLAGKYSFASNYPENAKAALAEMVRQCGTPEFQGDRMVKGVIVRHLVMPDMVEASQEVLRYLYDTYGDQIYISILNQYTPVADLEGYPELKRKITEDEYEDVVDFAIYLGVEQGFIQEGDTAKESFIPSFDITGI